jgi:putative transposase
VVPIADPVITPRPLCLALAEGDEACRSRYRSLLAEEIPEGELAALRDATNGGFALGSDRFQRQIAAMVGQCAHLAREIRPAQEGGPRRQTGKPAGLERKP